MKKAAWCAMLCLSIGLGAARGQDLKIDFSLTAGAVQAGYQAYRADHEVPATFTAQSFPAFGTTVTITPTWAAGAAAAAMQMIDRGGDDGTEVPDLVRDWIGTDGRQPGDPMTLTISGLPAGSYRWVSIHHDPQDQTGIFDVTVNDGAGSKTTTGIDISNTQGTTVTALADMTKFTTTIISNGTDLVSLVFRRTSATDPVANAFFLMNAFDLTVESTGGAMLPTPASQATDVLRDGTTLSWLPGTGVVTHNVYLGTDPAAVDAATTADAAYMGRQDDTSFDPGRLELGRTYYWRVDEVTSDGTITKGAVWNFTVEPVSIPLSAGQISASASSSNSAGEGPGQSVNDSGLNAESLHAVDTKTMWLSAPADPGPVWIQYQFNKVYKLHEMLVWNHNSSVEPIIGFGAKSVTVEYSSDGAAWTALGATHEFARAPGEIGYVANTTIDFGGTAARYVRITIASNWGGVLKQYGLSEVRFMVVPVAARQPVPDVGETGVDPRFALTWRAGREAATHRVYLSTDVNEVTNGTALAGTVSQPEFDAAVALALGKTYYWKVNEVNDAAAWEGDIWNFSTAAFLPVDDMESYDDAEGTGTRIYETWVDGWDVPANGSQVGHDGAPFAERTIIHGGAQSMPLYFDNSSAAYSEATRTFDDPQDWTQFGVKGLVFWFFGDPANTAGQLYVKVNGKKVAYDGDPDNVLRKPWQMWYIDLAGFTGVNLAKVTELTIGLEGGQGVVFIDDIGLSPNDRQLVTPGKPAATNLMAQYSFEGNANDSVGAHNGTVGGAPTYVAGKVGQAIKLNGVQDYVLVESSFDLPVYSAAVWFQVEGGTGNRDLISVFNDAALHGALLEVTSTGGLRFLHRAPVGSTGGDADIRNNAKFDDGSWYHVAIVKSADSTTLYINGEQAGSAASTTQFDQALTKIALGMLKYPINTADARYFPGAIDEVYLYNRVLSEAEIAWLAGRTKPFDKP